MTRWDYFRIRIALQSDTSLEKENNAESGADKWETYYITRVIFIMIVLNNDLEEI